MDKKFSLALLETQETKTIEKLSLSRGSERLRDPRSPPLRRRARRRRRAREKPGRRSRASSCSSSSSSEPAPRGGAGRRRRRRQPESRRELGGDGPAGLLAGCQSRSERRDLFPERRGLPPRELRLCLGELPRPHGLAEQAGVEQGRVGGQGSGLLPLLLLEGSVGGGGGSGRGEQGDRGRCRAGGGRAGGRGTAAPRRLRLRLRLRPSSPSELGDGEEGREEGSQGEARSERDLFFWWVAAGREKREREEVEQQVCCEKDVGRVFFFK